MPPSFRVARSSSNLFVWLEEGASERIRELCMSYQVKKASYSFSKYQNFFV